MAKFAKKVTVFENGLPVGVDFEWTDGTVSNFRTADVNSALIQWAAVHGFSQKLGDAYAGDKDQTLEEAKAKFQVLFDHLTSGTTEWNLGGRQASTGGILAEALARVSGKDLETCRAKLQGMEEAEIKALKKHPQIVAAIKAIELERAEARAEAAEDLPIEF